MTEFVPRDWQRRGADTIVSNARAGSDRALIYGCPGSGKTYGSLLCAQELIHRLRKTEEIVVITPNRAIKSQWIARAQAMGIDLEEVSDAKVLHAPRLRLGQIHGFIMNYQQAVRMKHSLRIFCENTNPIVIPDEVHHTAGRHMDRDGNAWGTALEYACAAASFKLPTTGTPFREGNHPIAFVHYNEAGEATAHVRYPYGDAIRDGVCRRVEFECFDGEVVWQTKDGRHISADFQRKLNNKLERERLQAAISPDGDFPVKMLAAAHEKLMDIRAAGGVDASAGALIVATDIANAEAFSAIIEEMTGEKPTLVHNELDDAKDQIDAYRDSDAKWIVGISMISEGVDIPRLRVGVYASRVRAALYFHQFVGRFTRVQESRSERAYVFIPADAELQAIAREIEKEQYHAIDEYVPRGTRRGGGGGGGPRGLDVIRSDSEMIASASGGLVFPAEYQRIHRERIERFRATGVAHGMSDVHILQLLIAAEAIEPPRKQAS